MTGQPFFCFVKITSEHVVLKCDSKCYICRLQQAASVKSSLDAEVDVVLKVEDETGGQVVIDIAVFLSLTDGLKNSRAKVRKQLKNAVLGSKNRCLRKKCGDNRSLFITLF